MYRKVLRSVLCRETDPTYCVQLRPKVIRWSLYKDWHHG